MRDPQPRDARGHQRTKNRIGDTPKVLRDHGQNIDETGGPPIADQNITIEGGKITAISAGADQSPSAGTTILALRGYAVMPGIVGMHDHLYCFAFPNLRADYSFERPGLSLEMSFSAPRLYLANGVTTIRTAGTYEPYTELKLKPAIEKGTVPGPHPAVTGPYLDERRTWQHE